MESFFIVFFLTRIASCIMLLVNNVIKFYEVNKMTTKINRTNFNVLLEKYIGIDKQVLDRVGGSLKEAGLVPVGGRGRNAPLITFVDAKNILLGVLATDNASQAGKAVMDASEWKNEAGRTLGDVITNILDESEKRFLAYITVFRNFPQAEIGWTVEGRTIIDSDGVERDDPLREVFRAAGVTNDPPSFRVEATILGRMLETIINALPKE